MRVLREMFAHGGELSAPWIAKRVGLSRQHVSRLIGGLAEVGIVEAVGLGGHLSYRVRQMHPLHQGIDWLFRAEAERFQGIQESIRRATNLDPRPAAVWLYGSVARGQDGARSDVDVAVVTEDEAVERVTEVVRERLRASEEALDFRASVVGISPADVLRLSAGDPWWITVKRGAIALSGPGPERLEAQVRPGRKVSGARKPR